MPDYYIYKAPTCACGDDPVKIPAERAAEGLAQKAHWCTGTLKMTDGFGNPKYIFNPHTYSELRTMMRGKIDPYLECISMRGQAGASVDDLENLKKLLDDDADAICEKKKPKVAALDSQQVSPIAVLERCKSNYQQKQWDVGAWLLYDSTAAAQAISGSVLPPGMDATDPVSICLLQAEKNHESNLACMSSYLSEKYYKQSASGVFWRYEKVFVSTGSDDTDACIVFSGPAKKNDSSATALEFQKCSHDYSATGCVIPHMVWSSSSANKIPVATLHTVEDSVPENRANVAAAHFAEARYACRHSLQATTGELR